MARLQKGFNRSGGRAKKGKKGGIKTYIPAAKSPAARRAALRTGMKANFKNGKGGPTNSKLPDGFNRPGAS